MKTQITDWNDIHVAYQVARLGTLSAAAEFLGVHHSTILRRVNALEERLKTRLFHRHARGYSLTEAGKLLLNTAQGTQDEFDRLLGKLQGVDEQLEGTLIVTSVGNMAKVFTPMFAAFQDKYPQIRLEFISDNRVLKLEHGEAHVSIRPGADPKEPDYIAQKLTAHASSTLYASQSYLNKYGNFNGLDDIEGHRFVSTVQDLSKVPFMSWLSSQVPEQQIYYRVTEFNALIEAVRLGMGIGPGSCWLCNEIPDLIPLLPPPPQWANNLWLVTHKDMHRTRKVQAFTQFIKEAFIQQADIIQGSNLRF